VLAIQPKSSRPKRPTFSLEKKIGPGRHHFSILVYNLNRGEEEYLELKPNFHRKYPSKRLFREGWNRLVRPLRDASSALCWRARRVLKRAHITPLETRYVTTMTVYDSVTKQVRFQRHVVAVKLSDAEFRNLLDDGFLRPLYKGSLDVPMSARYAVLEEIVTVKKRFALG